MDWACQEVFKTVQKNPNLGLLQLVRCTGFARQTVFTHLKHLVDAGKIIRVSVRSKRGRPSYIYKTKDAQREEFFKRLDKFANKEDLIQLPFSKLKGACRSEKFNHCNRRNNLLCIPKNCPLITEK
jgi:hypothetical protein